MPGPLPTRTAADAALIAFTYCSRTAVRDSSFPSPMHRGQAALNEPGEAPPTFPEPLHPLQVAIKESGLAKPAVALPR